jgi:hypothetical protein
MAIIRNPALLTQQFGVDPKLFADLGIFDPILNADTNLFIDPLLLQQSHYTAFSKDAVACFEKFFGDMIVLLESSTDFGDISWRNADRRFTFKEPRETCLGYSDSTIHGNAIGPKLRARVMRTAKHIIQLGINNTKLFALLGLLEEGIGADRISDLTTHAIKSALIRFNVSILPKLKIRTTEFRIGNQNVSLVSNPFEAKEPTPVLLVPTDILRELPIANDWSEIGEAAQENSELRDRVNETIGEIWLIRTKKEKDKAREAMLGSRKAFQAVLDAVDETKKLPYDPKADPEGHYLWRRCISEFAKNFPLKIKPPQHRSLAELERIVDIIIKTFIDLIENKGQWFHLWQNGEPRHERAAQRLFFAIAEVYCKANNLDVSPETNSGGGPVDFKFSSGYDARVLVEVKMSRGRVVHGYRTQLEIYKQAESTSRGKYLVVDVGRMGKKLDEIYRIRNARVAEGVRASDIFIADGSKKLSASVRH